MPYLYNFKLVMTDIYIEVLDEDEEQEIQNLRYKKPKKAKGGR